MKKLLKISKETDFDIDAKYFGMTTHQIDALKQRAVFIFSGFPKEESHKIKGIKPLISVQVEVKPKDFMGKDFSSTTLIEDFAIEKALQEEYFDGAELLTIE